MIVASTACPDCACTCEGRPLQAALQRLNTPGDQTVRRSQVGVCTKRTLNAVQTVCELRRICRISHTRGRKPMNQGKTQQPRKTQMQGGEKHACEHPTKNNHKHHMHSKKAVKNQACDKTNVQVCRTHYGTPPMTTEAMDPLDICRVCAGEGAHSCLASQAWRIAGRQDGCTQCGRDLHTRWSARNNTPFPEQHCSQLHRANTKESRVGVAYDGNWQT